MKHKQTLFSNAGTPVEDLPVEVRDHVESDPQLLQEMQDQARIASLIKLKNYEQPDPEMEGRTLHRVNIRIQNGEHLQKVSRIPVLPDWARMVAVVLFMLTLSVITHREMLDDPSMDSEMESAVVETFVPIEPMIVLESKSEGPFSTTTIPLPEEEFPNLMTPEFMNQLESSFFELGLDFSEPEPETYIMPVSLSPPR